MKNDSGVKLILGLLLAAGTVVEPLSAAITPVADKVACAVTDRQAFTQPDQVRLSGWLGSRIEANEANRLVKIDVDRLLEGYRKRPGRQSWDGEHVGKWLHAATLAWVNTGDPALRQKLDYVAAELMQVPTGGRLSRHLSRQRPLDRMGRLGAQVQSHRPDHLHALHRQHGAAGHVPADGRSALQHFRR